MVTARMRLVYLLPVCLLTSVPAARGQPAAPGVERNNAKRTTVEVKEVERRFTKPEGPAPVAKEQAQPMKLEAFLTIRKEGMKDHRCAHHPGAVAHCDGGGGRPAEARLLLPGR